MPFVILPTNSASGGYDITNSLRFNSSSSDNLSRTPASASNRKTWTWSGWVKRSALSSSSTYEVFCGDNGATSFTAIRFASDQIYAQDYVSGSKNNIWGTNAVYRDPSAWYHIVVKYDTTQASSTNAVLIYINNNSQTLTFDTAGLGAYVQNYDGIINSTNPQKIGEKASTNYFAGYMSEINFIDGQALTPSSFGETDEDTGIWKPKAYTGTYGTNGFYLQFKNSASLGTDSSGNGNNFTVNNLTSIDQTTDTPTNNFATLNPLSKVSSSTLTEGNLKESKSNKGGVVSTLAVNKGKWYCEVKIDTVGTDPQIGIYAVDAGTVGYQTTYLGVDAYSMGYLVNDAYVIGYNAVTANSYGSAFSNGDIMIIALDMDNKKMWFGKNGTWFSSGNPATGANPVQSISAFPADVTNNFQAFATGSNLASDNAVYSFNFGNPSFTISSGNADGAGFGNFEYAVPSGFYALCTKNLATFG